MIDWQESSWKRTTLLTDRAVRLSTAKAYVFSDSILCMGRISENPASARKEKTDRFMNSSQCRELDRIDGEPMEFEWKNFPGFIALQILAEIHNMMTGIQCEPEQFPGRIIFMSVYYDIVWSEKGSEELCSGHSKTVTEYARRLAHGHWSFLGPGSEKKWYGTHTYKPNGEWDRVAEDMMINFSESGHPVFRGSSALERGALRRKGNGKCPYISVVTTTQPKWFFAQSFPSISSVSTEQ